METYIELGYISPDWRIAKSKKLKEIALNYCAETFEVDNNQLYWITDDINHQRLIVKKSSIPSSFSDEDIKALITHFDGFMWGIGCL